MLRPGAVAIIANNRLGRFSDVDLVIEAATERLDIKHAIFRDLELHCPGFAVLLATRLRCPFIPSGRC